MKAMIIETFGGAETLKLAEIKKPTVGDNEVLVEVKFTSVNPVDWKIREGYLKDMFPHLFPIVLGWDAAGIVTEVGPNVRQFKPGDSVFAYTRKPEVQSGTYAEFIALNESAVAHMPENANFSEAASIPLAGLTAFQALFDFAELKAGQKVLILGGAGGVGGLAIQLAKAAGAIVTATTSAKNSDYVASLGADQVVDYNTDAVQRLNREFDVVFDAVGGKAQIDAQNAVKDSGHFVSIVDTPNESLFTARQVKSGFVFVAPNGLQLTKIAKLMEQNKVKALPRTEMKLEQAAEAHAFSESHRTKGKIVLRIK